ncbi:MAG: serine/threonine-protein kinase [bacterium]
MARTPARDARPRASLRRGEKLGKYKLLRRLGEGGYADVWRAMDTVEGVPVALKLPRRPPADAQVLADFHREAHILSQLDHPNILRLKNADIISGRLVLAYDLGLGSLDHRMGRRHRTGWALEVVRQLLEALGAAHEKKIMHRDVKPENIILFPGDRVRLGDFCIARLANAKLTQETSSGTLGFMAPEQAYGRPALASDVFAAGLVLHQLLTGQLPPWPFDWPYPGLETLRRKAPPEMITVIRRATAFQQRARYPDASRMLAAYNYALSKFRRLEAQRKARRSRKRRRAGESPLRWERIRLREFEKRFRKRYGLHFSCRKCGNPIGEAMPFCPWCGTDDNSLRNTTGHPAYCYSCERGVRMEWDYCPWCYTGRFADAVNRPHSDARYTQRCANPACPDRRMMPFMRYCPWCKTKVKRPIKCEEGEKPCRHCRWPVPAGFWTVCAWCGKETS